MTNSATGGWPPIPFSGCASARRSSAIYSSPPAQTWMANFPFHQAASVCSAPSSGQDCADHAIGTSQFRQRRSFGLGIRFRQVMEGLVHKVVKDAPVSEKHFTIRMPVEVEARPVALAIDEPQERLPLAA